MFHNEDEQKDFERETIPSGSIVTVKLNLNKPKNVYRNNTYLNVANTGLIQLPIKLTVVSASYKGNYFYENITMPLSLQEMTLNQKQQTACRIGGATMKAICLSGGINPNIKTLDQLNDLTFPIRVGVNKKPSFDKQGNEYWNNKIQKIITQNDDEFNQVRNNGEIINVNGAVVGVTESNNNYISNNNSNYNNNNNYNNYESEIDKVPF